MYSENLASNTAEPRTVPTTAWIGITAGFKHEKKVMFNSDQLFDSFSGDKHSFTCYCAKEFDEVTFEFVHVTTLLPSHPFQKGVSSMEQSHGCLPPISCPATSGRSAFGIRTCIIVKEDRPLDVFQSFLLQTIQALGATTPTKYSRVTRITKWRQSLSNTRSKA